MKNIVALHRRSVDLVRPVVARVTPADLALPTPCAGWDLRALLEHMTGQDHGFAAAVDAARAGGEADAAAFAPRPLGPSPAATLAAGLDAVVAAFADADGLEEPVLMPEFGVRLPLTTVAGMHLVDTLVHGWDVATALGAQAEYDARLEPEVVAAGLGIAEQVPDDASRDAPGAPFARAVPTTDDADAWTRTLCLLGRDPAWVTVPR
jgi:uncharacterized protein (TIGR03086 family)